MFAEVPLRATKLPMAKFQDFFRKTQTLGRKTEN